MYEKPDVQAYWDVPVYADNTCVKANRVNPQFVDHKGKKVRAVKMSCPWVENRGKKDEEKTVKYSPLRWELRKRYLRYNINQCNIFIDLLGGWSKELEMTVKKLVGCVAKNVESLNLVLAQLSRELLFKCLTELTNVLGPNKNKYAGNARYRTDLELA